MNHTSTLCILALLVLASCPASAQIFRWVDAEGRVHYTDKPPRGVTAERVRVRSSPPPPVVTPAEEAAVVEGDAARAKSCSEARQQLAYVDLRRVDKPAEVPASESSRESQDRYARQLAAWEQFDATRRAHQERADENCDD